MIRSKARSEMQPDCAAASAMRGRSVSSWSVTHLLLLLPSRHLRVRLRLALHHRLWYVTQSSSKIVVRSRNLCLTRTTLTLSLKQLFLSTSRTSHSHLLPPFRLSWYSASRELPILATSVYICASESSGTLDTKHVVKCSPTYVMCTLSVVCALTWIS